MRDCIDEGNLQAWFDGELAANEAANITLHVNRCPTCAAAAQTLKAENSILSAGLSAEFAQPVPTEHLRQRLDAAVAEMRLAKAATIKRSWTDVLRDLFPSVRALSYAAAAAAILLAGSLLVVYLRRNPSPTVVAVQPPIPLVQPSPQPGPKPVPPPDEIKTPPKVTSGKPKPRPNTAARPEPPATSLAWQEQQYERAIAKLNEAIKAQPPMRPSLQVEYEYNLALVDSAITTTRDVARKNPKDPQAAQFMLAAYQSKVDLMNQIAEARVLER